MVPVIDPPPLAHRIAASSKAVPLALKLAAVSSNKKRPTRRAGAVSPGIATPGSYAKIAVFVASPAIVATETALALGLPQSKVLPPLRTATVAERPATSG